MVNLEVMPAFPTDVSNTGAITDYAINIGVIFAGFVIAAILLSLVMLIMCCCFCCRKPKENSQKYLRLVHIGISISIVVIAVFACGFGWKYNYECDSGVKHMSGSVNTLVGGANGLLGDLNTTISNLASNLNAQVVNTTNQIQVSTIMDPLNNIIAEIDEAQVSTNNLVYLADDMADNTTDIKTDFEFMSNSSVGLSDVPGPNDVPDIDDSFKTDTRSANASVADLHTTAVKIKNQVNSTLADISDGKLAQMRNQSADYTSQVNKLSSNFDDIRSQLKSFDRQFNGTYKPQIENYSYIRTTVVTAVLVLPISITIVAVAGVLLKNIVILKLCAILSFLFFFWYMLIAGVNHTLYTVSHGFCLAKDDIINSALSGLKGNTTVGNHSFAMSEKVQELLKCSGNTSLIEVFEADFLIDDLLDKVTNQAQGITDQANGLNFTDDFATADNDLDNFRNKSHKDFNQNKNITAVQEKLSNNIITLTSLETSAQANFNDTLASVNYITQNADDGHGGTIHITYTQSNISSLDCNDTTWATIPEHDNLCGNQTASQNALQTLLDVEDTLAHAVDAKEKVDAIPSDLVKVNDTQTSLDKNADNIQIQLAIGNSTINAYKQLANSVVSNLINFLHDGVNSIKGATGCSFVGNSYSGFTNGFCQEFSPSLQVIGAMMVLGAGALFGVFINSVVAIYKIEGAEDDDDLSAYAYNNDEEKGKKNVSLQVRSSTD